MALLPTISKYKHFSLHFLSRCKRMSAFIQWNLFSTVEPPLFEPQLTECLVYLTNRIVSNYYPNQWPPPTCMLFCKCAASLVEE